MSTIPYLMQKKRDCGPRLQSAITGIPFEDIAEVRSWEDYEDIRDDLMDSHWHNFVALDKMNIPYKKYTPKDVIEGKCKGGTTAVLFHAKEAPFTSQHWVLLKRTSPGEIIIDLGNGTNGLYTEEQFMEYADNGWPRIVYSVGEDGGEKAGFFANTYVLIINALVTIASFLFPKKA
jgi:hypothetical protein